MGVTVTYGNTTVGSLTQLGQKMRIPSTTLTQDGPVYYLDDITIECSPTSGNQVRCSYWDPYQSDYTDIFATEDAVIQVLDVADQLAFGPIMITYEEVPETTFTIDGTTYDVDADTAYWYDWVNSSYAPSGSSLEMDPTSSTYFVHLGGTASNYGIFYNGSLQAPGDEIVVGRAYTTGAAYEQHDLTGTTWYFNSSLDYPFVSDNYSLNFTSNSVSYTNLQLDDYSMYYSNPNVTATAYGPQSGPPDWTNQNYRTISITGGTDATNAALYAFISANATQAGVGRAIINFQHADMGYTRTLIADAGMTWTQWCSSSYNSYNYRIYAIGSADRVQPPSREPGRAVAYNDTAVAPSDVIVAGRVYNNTDVTNAGGVVVI